MGVITKSEQKMEDMIEILEKLQKYFPKNSNGEPVVTFLAGDQLTCERVRGAERARVQSEDPLERFQGILETPGDWHALMTFYQARACTLHCRCKHAQLMCIYVYMHIE